MPDTVIELSKQVTAARYFSFSRQGGRPPVPVNLFFGGLEHCREDYLINRRGFPVHLLEYVVEGAGRLVLRGEEHPLRKGCFYLYGPGIPCKIMTSPERPLVKYFFAFHARGGEPDRLYKLDRQFFEPGPGGDTVGDLVRLLFHEGVAATEDSWRICCCYLDIILLKCARSRAAAQFSAERAWLVFSSVKDYIEANALRLRRMPDIAAGVGLDPSYISRLFKRYYHLTPYNFLLKCKMEHALDLLLQGRASVQATAQRVGFDDPFHLSRVFKRFKGIPPGKVRA